MLIRKGKGEKKTDNKEQYRKKQLKEKIKERNVGSTITKEKYASSLGTEIASCSSQETLVTIYQSIRCHILVHFNLHTKRTASTRYLSHNYTGCMLYRAA